MGLRKRFQPWWETKGKYDVSWGLLAPVAAWGAVFVGSLHYERALNTGPVVVLAEAALGTALLAVVLTALSILVAFLSEEYVEFLEASPIGIDGAIHPYLLVSSVSGIATVLGLGAAIAWEVLPHWSKAAAVATSTAFTVWAVVGVVELVLVTASHGKQRARLPEIRDAARQKMQERRTG